MTERDIFIDQERMYRLFRNERGRLGLGVLCGGIGMYEVKLLLDDEEQRGYEAGGQPYLNQLARDIAANPGKYEARTFG